MIRKPTRSSVFSKRVAQAAGIVRDNTNAHAKVSDFDCMLLHGVASEAPRAQLADGVWPHANRQAARQRRRAAAWVVVGPGWAITVQGLAQSSSRRPYGTLTAISLEKADI